MLLTKYSFNLLSFQPFWGELWESCSTGFNTLGLSMDVGQCTDWPLRREIGGARKGEVRVLASGSS